MGRKKKPLPKSSAAAARPGTGPGIPAGVVRAGTRIAGCCRMIGSYATRHPRALLIAAMCCIIAVGIYFRLEDLGAWRQNPGAAFFNHEPLHTTFDAWFYLSLAQDLVDGSYAPVDERRGIPDSPPRPSPPPLLSVIAAGIAMATPLSMNWIGALLPALLGPLLALPMYLVCRRFGGPAAGLVAALLSVLYPFYIHRSTIGRFDTDCMIITLTMVTIWCFMRFALVTSVKRYIYCASGLIVYVLFLWWWDQAPAAVTAITILPFGIALILFYRPHKFEGFIFYGSMLLGVLVLLAVFGLDVPMRTAASLWSKFLYISKDTASLFPNIGLTISEQSRPSLSVVVAYTTQNTPAFVFALAGLALLIFRRFTLALFLLPFFVLSFLALTQANRFLIFLIPLLAAGSGQAVSELWRLRVRFAFLNGIIPLGIILLAVPLYRANTSFVQWPKEPGFIIEGMDFARSNTPDDAVIWAWWDHGYALNYFARRATINDGSIHSGERTVYNAVPYASDSFRLSANFMCFYVERGMAGIRSFYRASGVGRSKSDALLMQILREGPEKARIIIESTHLAATDACSNVDEWIEFFFPASPRPLYLMLDNLLAKTASWWYWFGTWNIEAKDGMRPLYYPFYGIKKSEGILNDSTGSLRIDTRSGMASVNSQQFSLAHLVTSTGSSRDDMRYYTSGRLSFELHEPTGYGALMDAPIAESVFNRLFVRHEHSSPYFTPVRLKSPGYQLWKVQGDRPVP